MLGKTKNQLSLMDVALNGRPKRSQTEQLLKQIDQFVDWNKLVKAIEPFYNKSKRSRPS